MNEAEQSWVALQGSDRAGKGGLFRKTTETAVEMKHVLDDESEHSKNICNRDISCVLWKASSPMIKAVCEAASGNPCVNFRWPHSTQDKPGIEFRIADIPRRSLPPSGNHWGEELPGGVGVG